MTKGKTLQDRLAQSLDNANKKEAKAKKPKVTKPAKNPPAKPPAADRQCKKLSVSLFDTDLTRLDAIRDYMAAQGHRISTSQAVKLALRSAPLSDKLLTELDAIKSEDGRRW